MGQIGPSIYLDMFSDEFRRGYDCSSVINAMRIFIEKAQSDDNVDSIFVKINKSSSSFIEGVLSENMFHFEYKNPQNIRIQPQEIWVKIKPIKKRHE